MNTSPADYGIEAAALEGDLVGFDPPSAPARTMAGGEDGGEVCGPERAGLAAAALAGGSPVAGENPGGAFPGRARLSGEAGPEARRGGRHRGARRRPARAVELGEVGGEVLVVEGPAGEPGVEAADRPGVRPAGVRGDGGLGEPAGGRARAVERGLDVAGPGERISHRSV